MKQKILNDLGYFAIISLVCLIFYSGYAIANNNPVITNNITNYVASFDCDNASYNLLSAVNCLNKRVVADYNFNDSEVNDSITINDSYLYLRGGDCKDYADYYSRHLKEYGYKNITIMRYNINTTMAHVYLIVYNSNYHCTIDQKEYKCFKRG